MTPEEHAKKIFETAQKNLQKDYERLMSRLEPVPAPGYEKVPVFVSRILAWQADSDQGHMYLYGMFREAFSYDELSFFGSFNSFVGNCLLDDSYFVIEWRKTDYAMKKRDMGPLGVREVPEVQYLPGGEIKTTTTTKEDPAGRPFVKWSNDDNGTQKVELLLEAMDILVQRDTEHMKKMEESTKIIERLHKTIKGE